MIRNLFASAIIFVASTSVFANDIEDSLKVEGATSSSVVTAALSACKKSDSGCIAAVIEDAIDAGITPSSVMKIALAANIPIETITDGLSAAGVTDQDVFTAIANNVDPSTTGLPTNAGLNTTERKSLTNSGTPSGVSNSQ